MRRQLRRLRRTGLDAVIAMDAVAGSGGVVSGDGWSCVEGYDWAAGLVLIALRVVAVALALLQLLVLVVSVAGLSDLKQRRSRTSGD
jgi:hypothetical protein